MQQGETGLKNYLEKEVKEEKITSSEANDIYKELTGTDKAFEKSEKETVTTVTTESGSGVKTAESKSTEVIKEPPPAVTLTEKEEKEVKLNNDYSEGYKRRLTNSPASTMEPKEPEYEEVKSEEPDKEAYYEKKYAGMDYAELVNEAARIEAEFLTGEREEMDYDETAWLRNRSRATSPDEVIAYHRDKAYERADKAEQKANAQRNTVSYSPQNEGAWLKEQSENSERKNKRESYNKLKEEYLDEAGMYQKILEERGVADNYLRDATIKDITVNSFKRGYNTRNLGKEIYKNITGQNNSHAYYDELLKGKDYNFKPGNRFEKMVSNASEFLGGQAHQWTDPEAVGAGLGAAGGTILAGQAGPQAALPEEILTAPAAYLAANLAFQAKSAFEVEAGLAYREMLENGIDEHIARNIALGVGGINGLLEAVQINDLVKSFKILDASDLTKPFVKKLYNYIAKRFGNATAETVVEMAQEGVTMGGVNLGGKIDKGESVYGWKEMRDRLGDTAESTFAALMLLGGAGDSITNIYNSKMTVRDIYSNVIRNPYDAKALERVRNMTETERIYAKAGANAEEISVAAGRAAGHEYDGRKELEAYEYGITQRKNGKGKDLEVLIDATDYLDEFEDSGIINTEYGSGELAKPYSSELIPAEINNYINRMPDYGSYIEVNEELDFYDISLMSRQTGTEFASVTIGDKHYLIKGDEKGTPISEKLLEEMRVNGGTLNCHSHPYVGDLKVSKSDLKLAKEMYWQDKFYVISPDGRYAVYNKNGIIEVRTANRWISNDNKKFYEDLFKE